MGMVFKALDGSTDAVFCGDTNINERDCDGPVALPTGWVDAWTALRPDERGATFDVERNKFVQAHDRWAKRNHARLRFDRFWVRLGAGYRLGAVELVDDPCCSDHFGVLLDLEPQARPHARG